MCDGERVTLQITKSYKSINKSQAVEILLTGEKYNETAI